MPVRSTMVALIRRLRLEPLARRCLAVARRARALTTTGASRASRSARRIARLPAQWALATRFRQLLRRRINFDELRGIPDADALAIVVCLWNRPGRLADVLRIVDAQQSSRRLRLILWNNDPHQREHYRSTIAGFTPQGALDSVEFFNSPTNIGGMGRFVAARELVTRGYSGPYLMMDDDQDFSPTFVEDLLASAHPGSFAGVWAWNNNGAYWNRTQVQTSGASADHVGTGGSICDSALLTDKTFFTAIPIRFLFMEDIWMSHYVRRNGGQLTMVSSPFEFTLSELDQGHALFDYKEDFYRWLQQPARIPLRASGVV